MESRLGKLGAPEAKLCVPQVPAASVGLRLVAVQTGEGAGPGAVLRRPLTPESASHPSSRLWDHVKDQAALLQVAFVSPTIKPGAFHLDFF